MQPVSEQHLGVVTWLETFAADVRGKDYAHARTLFAQDVLAFGTRVSVMTRRLELEGEQWRPIWAYTEDFSFSRESLNVFSDCGLHVAAATWYSTGFNDRGDPFMRHGRATVVLLEDDAGKLTAVHCHFSLKPNQERLYPPPCT